MSPDRFETIRDALGWSTRYIAKRLGINRYIVSQWASGKEAIPANVDAWLEVIVAGIETAPLPHGWVVSGDPVWSE
jgi:transcriptional regulator with XRE-family HTH domain